MFNPFPGRSAEFFTGANARRMAGQLLSGKRAAADAVMSAVNNAGYVASARKKYEANKREQQAAQNAATAAQRSTNTNNLIGAGIGVAGGIAAALI